MLIILIISVFIYSIPITAQEQYLGNNLKGTWQQSNNKLALKPWKAQWIWLNDSIISDVLLARKTFKLTTIPQTSSLRITATSQYQLFINGKYVRRGPARSAPHHQSFDILDVSDFLQVGTNVIAVRVHCQKKKFSYNLVQRGGLLAQLDLDVNGKNSHIFTNAEWKVSEQSSWDNNSPTISRFQQIVNDRVDMRKHLKGWKEIDFDASNWTNATPLLRTEGWPSVQKNDRPFELATPWTALVPREVPYLIENIVKAKNLIQATQIAVNNKASIPLSKMIDKAILKSTKNYAAEKAPLQIPIAENGKSWCILFDLGEIVNGTPILEIEGVSGTEVEIVGAPFVVDENFTYKIVDSEYRDKIILSGGKDYWEATYFKPTRYLGIIIHADKAPVNLYTLATRQYKYPFKKKGNIKSKEAPWLQYYMDATAKTITVCTTDAYTDNYRERRQYAQTGYYAALGNYYLFGDTALQRRYLVQTAQEQQANGIMPAYAPAASDDYMIILDSNCLWIRSLYNYLLYSGDYKTVRELLPAAKKLMQLLESFTNDVGLINNPPYPYWLDHALLDRRGANFNLNGHYLGALDDFAKLLTWLDKPESELYKAKAKQLRQSLQHYFWNEEKQLFVDALIDKKQSTMFSEHSNATALALKIATPTQAKKIATQLLVKDDHNYIKRESGLIMVTPAMSYYLHKGLCEYGYIDASFEMFRNRFDKMLAPETNGTLWEEWRLNGIGRSGKLEMGRTRSDAQTESAFVPALFAEYILGIKPTKPGMKEAEISLTNINLKKVAGIIPTPQGNMTLKWDTTKTGNRSLELTIPSEMKVNINLMKVNDVNRKSIMVDNQPLDIAQIQNNYFQFSEGKHRIQF